MTPKRREAWVGLQTLHGQIYARFWPKVALPPPFHPSNHELVWCVACSWITVVLT